MSNQIKLDRFNLNKIPENILKNMVSYIVQEGTKNMNAEQKADFLKNFNYKNDHNKWNKIQLINFLVAFKPEIRTTEVEKPVEPPKKQEKPKSKKDRIAELEKELARLKEEEDKEI